MSLFIIKATLLLPIRKPFYWLLNAVSVNSSTLNIGQSSGIAAEHIAETVDNVASHSTSMQVGAINDIVD